MLFIDGRTRKWHGTKSVVKKKNIYGPTVLNNFSQGTEALRIFISIFHV